MKNILSIFPTSVLWSADISDVFTPTTISAIVAVPSGIFISFFIAHLTHKTEVTDIILGLLVCGQDAVSDYLLIGDWYFKEDYW